MFKFNEITFVPAPRQVTAYFSEQDAQAEHRPVAIFTQLENMSTEFELIVGNAVIKLEGDYPNVKPTPDVLVQWMDCIEENIAPYLQKGIITPVKTRGDITIDRQDGIWFMTRGDESITFDNSKYLPNEDCDAWVGYVTQCRQCGGKKEFEFAAIDASVLHVPEGVTLADHLRPFIQAMETEIRDNANKQRGSTRMGPLGWLLDEMGSDSTQHNHTTDVLDVVVGKPSITARGAHDKVGAVALDGQEVLAFYHDHAVVLGVNVGRTSNEAYHLNPRLCKALLEVLEELTTIALEDITSENFSGEVMDLVATLALSATYPVNGNGITHELYRTMRTVAIPGTENYWLRVLVNVWFMKAANQYSEKQIRSMMTRMLRDLSSEMDIEEARSARIAVGLDVVVREWFAE